MMMMTISSAALHLNVQWKTLHGILLNFLLEKYGNISYEGVARIAIDEIHYPNYHDHITIVMDLDTKRHIFVNFSENGTGLSDFFKLLGDRCRLITLASVNMTPDYLSAVRNTLPNAIIVIDSFHVLKLANDMLDNLRKLEYVRSNRSKKLYLIKRKFLLLKNPQQSDHEKNEHKRLDDVVNHFPLLKEAYNFKLELSKIWDQISRSSAASSLDKLINLSRNSKKA